MAVPAYGSLPFREAIDFLRGKTSIPTRRWQDIQAGEHDMAFMVAGANKMAIVEDLRAAVDEAIADGGTIEQFRKNFDGVVQNYGWSYKGGRGWRTRVIYDTNLRQAYNAGREAQWAQNAPPFFRYKHGDSETPRPLHLSWDGLVLPADDPWWATHSPMNGWGCTCKKFAVYRRQLTRLGKSGPDAAPDDGTFTWTDPDGNSVQVPNGIDPGFQAAPGRMRLRAQSPPALDAWPTGAPTTPPRRATDALPPARSRPASRLLPDNLSDQEYVDAFLSEFGAVEKPTLFTDAIGEPVLISDELFKRADGSSKANKGGRGPSLLLVADALREPDEIWAVIEPLRSRPGKYLLRRRYLAEWRVAGAAANAITTFEYSARGWTGVTAFLPHGERGTYLEQQRRGVRLYRRGD